MNEPTTKEEALNLMSMLSKSFNILNREYIQREIINDKEIKPFKQTIAVLNDIDFLNKYTSCESSLPYLNNLYKTSQNFSYTNNQTNYGYIENVFPINQKNKQGSTNITQRPEYTISMYLYARNGSYSGSGSKTVTKNIGYPENDFAVSKDSTSYVEVFRDKVSHTPSSSAQKTTTGIICAYSNTFIPIIYYN